MTQMPQETLNGTTTRSPTRSAVTSEPVSTTAPHRFVPEDVARLEEGAEPSDTTRSDVLGAITSVGSTL